MAESCVRSKILTSLSSMTIAACSSFFFAWESILNYAEHLARNVLFQWLEFVRCFLWMILRLVIWLRTGSCCRFVGERRIGIVIAVVALWVLNNGWTMMLRSFRHCVPFTYFYLQFLFLNLSTGVSLLWFWSNSKTSLWLLFLAGWDC